MFRVRCCLAPLLAGIAIAQVHTHGDAVGSLTPTSAIVWTRASQLALVAVRYATDPTLAGAIETTPTPTQPAADQTARVPLQGLTPATRYWFVTKLVDPSSGRSTLGQTGTFLTPPAPGTAMPVRFVFTGDIRAGQPLGILDRMGAHDPHFFAMLGDFPYADGARTVPEYWVQHQLVRNDPTLWAFLQHVPMIGNWDDHEVVNDWDGATDPVLAQNGATAWRHWFPIPDGTTEIWRSLRFGDALEYFVLDTRSHRAVNEDPDLPGKPFLGLPQMDWLKNSLLASTATFKVVGTSVPLRFGTTGSDTWDGYQHSRQELFDWVHQHRIANVVFITADQHWAASHHHREGFREFQVGPAGTSTRAPRAFGDPERLWVRQEANYGLITIDPSAMPPTLTVEWHDAGGALWQREVVTASAPARVLVTADVPESRFELTGGPFLVANSGSAVELPYVEPGAYTATFPALDLGDGRPADLDLTIAPGARVHVAVDHRDLEWTAHRVLLDEGFDGPLQGFTIVDEGTAQGPSAWFTDAGRLVQNSNIYTPGSTIDRLGTMAVKGDPNWQDYTVRMRVQSTDNDVFGFVFRYRGVNDYYRFSIDSERGFRQLASRRSGAFRLLAQDTVGYQTFRWYELEAVVTGNRIRVWQDGQLVFDVTDADHPSGRVGLYCWGNHSSLFDDLVVRAGDARIGRPALFADDFGDSVLTGWMIVDTGTVSAPSMWAETGGVLRQTSNIYDGDLDGSHIPKLGTVAIAGPSVTDEVVEAMVMNGDNDAVGIVFRYIDANNHYRWSMDAERSYRRLAKVHNGTWSTLFEQAAGYSVGAWHRLAARCVGAEIEVFLDGGSLATVTDPTHVAGRAGLYCWGSDNVSFDDFRITAPIADRPTFASLLSGRTTTLVGRAPGSVGGYYVLALAGARAPGIPLALLDPADPRTLDLAADDLFFTSLVPNPVFVGFQGTVDPGGSIRASIDWPPLPFGGTVLYAGGWVFGPTGNIGELWPTVTVVIP